MIRDKTEVFEALPAPKALAVMAIPTVLSQLVVLFYNIADAWFIGRTNDPYMIGAASLVLTLFLSLAALANLFGAGGGSLMARLLGKKDIQEAGKTCSYSIAMAGVIALGFSLVCLCFMNPLLRLLGASDNTIRYARQYLLFTVVVGGVPTVLSLTMPMLLRNAGYAKEAGFGVSLGGILNVALDPLFMFVILPDGYQVLGAALATMLSNVVSMVYFISVFLRHKESQVLSLPKRLEKLKKESLSSLYSVGIPAAVTILMYDVVNIVLNRLAVGHGDIALAAVGIVMKVERLPMNVGLGICLGMVPLVAYNYEKGDFDRMDRVFSAARWAVMSVAVVSMAAFYLLAGPIVRLFIRDPETVRLGTLFLKGRCVASPFMLVGFQIVHFMQAVNRGRASFIMSIIRHLLLNIPAMLAMNVIFGMTGLIWSQAASDVINAVIVIFIYLSVHRSIVSRRLGPAETAP